MMGGDLQGTISGAASRVSTSAKTSNLNWRYAFDENPFMTSVRAGKISTTGLQGQRIIGGAISNDPIEPLHPLAVTVNEGPAVPDMLVGDVTVVEGNSGTKNVVFTVTLSSASTGTVTAQYATEIGADGFGENANSAVALTRRMLVEQVADAQLLSEGK